MEVCFRYSDLSPETLFPVQRKGGLTLVAPPIWCIQFLQPRMHFLAAGIVCSNLMLVISWMNGEMPSLSCPTCDVGPKGCMQGPPVSIWCWTGQPVHMPHIPYWFPVKRGRYRGAFCPTLRYHQSQPPCMENQRAAWSQL